MSAGLTFSDLASFGDWCESTAAALREMDLREPLAEIESRMVQRTRENFEGCHAPDGTPWEPLKDGSGRPPLEGLAGAIESAVTDTGVSVWIEDEKAGWHQNGTRTIPARPMVGITPAQQVEYCDIIAVGVAKKLAGG